MSKAPRTQSTWAFDFTMSKLDRRTRRTAIDIPAVLSDLVGADGNYEGGMRPHNGFLRELKLDFEVLNTGIFSSQATSTDANHDEESRILDFFPVSFAVGSNNYAYGMVCRVRRSGSTTVSDIKVRLWDSKNQNWTNRTVISDVEDSAAAGGSAGTPSEVDTSISSPMNVAVFGRFCYIFVKGRPAVLLQYNSAETGFNIVGADVTGTLLGPGLQPECEGPDDITQDLDDDLGHVIEPTEDYATGFGRIYLTNTLPENLENGAGISFGLSAQDDPEPKQLTPGGYSFAYFLMDSSTGRRTSLSVVGDCEESTFPESGGDFLPRYAALELAYNSDLYDQAWVYRSVRTEDAGGAYAAKILHLEAIIDLADYHTDYNASGGTNVDTSGATPLLEIVDGASTGDITYSSNNTITKNSGSWTNTPSAGDFVRITVNAGTPDLPANIGVFKVTGTPTSTEIVVEGTPFTDGTENTVTIDIYTVNASEDQFDTGGDWRHVIYYYTRGDKNLSFQETYEDYVFFETTLPKGGTATIYNGALLVSDIVGENISSDEEEQPDTDTRNISELRWSSLTGTSPELFAPSDRYVTKNPASRIIAFADAGPNVIGFSRDRQYHIRTEGTIIKVQEMHVGYGIAGRYCHASIGNRVYFLTERGLKSVASNGQLDAVHSLNMDTLQRWRGDLDSCSMAHDSVTGCLHILNPVKKEMLNIWFNSGQITRDEDVPFSLVKQGPWSNSYSGATAIAGGELVDRAIFMKNFADETYGSIPANYSPYAYTMDHKRIKIDTGGDARHAMMHLRGSLVGTVTSAGSSTVTCSSTIADAVDQPHIDGSYLYCVSVPSTATSAQKLLVGQKAMILGVNGGNDQSVVLEDGTFDSLPVGAVVVVSPVPFTIHTCRMIGVSESGQPFTKAMPHRVQVESLDISFTRVGGEADDTDQAKVLASVYQGDTDTAISEGVSAAKIREGVLAYAVPVSSVSDRIGGVAGVNMSTRIRVLCPDLDFVCLGAAVYGTMTSERRNYS